MFFQRRYRRGWIKEVGSRAELRGTLVHEIAIAIAKIYLWYVHIPRSCRYPVGRLTG